MGGLLQPSVIRDRQSACLAVLVLVLTVTSPALGCGWWGDGEDDGPDALVVEPDNRSGASGSPSTPAEMARLSRDYRLGNAVVQDYAQARRWARLAAEGGDVGAMNDLATMLEAGLGGPTDIAEARLWFRKSAERGFAPAQHSLAMMLRDGRGGPADPQEVSLWLRKAAEGGHVSAEIDLAEELWRRDDSAAPWTACFWWLVALESGAQGSPQRCQKEAPILDDQELIGIAQDAREWVRAHQQGHATTEGNRK